MVNTAVPLAGVGGAISMIENLEAGGVAWSAGWGEIVWVVLGEA